MVGLISMETTVAVAVEQLAFQDKVQRRRDVENMMWKYADYSFIGCSCGTNLKFPPSYKGQEIECPHCKLKHIV